MYRRNIDFVADPRSTFFEKLMQARKLKLGEIRLRRDLFRKLTTMPSRLLQMNRILARRLFSPEWDVDVSMCDDHAHILTVLPLKEDVEPEHIDVYDKAVFDDITRTIKEIVSEVVGGDAEIVDGRINEDEDGVLALVIELLVDTE